MGIVNINLSFLSHAHRVHASHILKTAAKESNKSSTNFKAYVLYNLKYLILIIYRVIVHNMI